MHLKKNFWVTLVLVFFLSIFAMFLLNYKEDRSKVREGEKTQFIKRSDAKVWRGKIRATPIHCFGPYAKIEVENPSDNQDYQFRLEVIYKADNGPAQIGLRNLNAGDEILFFRTLVIAKIQGREVDFCPIGIHYPGSYKGEPVINGYKVANLPKKK